jgi:glycosyltransferase involved in cell wall biosynthesis
MKISVIIAFHKEIDLIDRAVDSVISNSDPAFDFEILICNDGPISSDDIISKININARSVTSVVANIYGKGPGGARNTGLDASIGECIAFLDADDFWLPGKISAQMSAIRAGATFVPTAYRFDSSQAVVQPPASIDKALDIFLRRGIGTSTVMISRNLLSDLRFKNIRFAQDIDFWYALARSPHFRYATVEACYVEYSTGGSTKNKWVQLQYLHKVLRINDVPWLQHIRVLFSYVLSGVYNHYIKRLFV